jgi:hypothetical protein
MNIPVLTSSTERVVPVLRSRRLYRKVGGPSCLRAAEAEAAWRSPVSAVQLKAW